MPKLPRLYYLIVFAYLVPGVLVRYWVFDSHSARLVLEQVEKIDGRLQIIPYLCYGFALRRFVQPANATITEPSTRWMCNNQIPLILRAHQPFHIPFDVPLSITFRRQQIAAPGIVTSRPERIPHNPAEFTSNQHVHAAAPLN
jgi:hypothetical protein